MKNKSLNNSGVKVSSLKKFFKIIDSISELKISQEWLEKALIKFYIVFFHSKFLLYLVPKHSSNSTLFYMLEAVK